MLTLLLLRVFLLVSDKKPRLEGFQDATQSFFVFASNEEAGLTNTLIAVSVA
jgi:hypothetical protein